MLDVLDDEEREALTGYKRHAFQCRWLAENGIQHWVRKDGEPVVPRSAISGPGEERSEVRKGPCLDGLASGGSG